MHESAASIALGTDTSTGTPVSLVVPSPTPSASGTPGHPSTPPSATPPHHLPFTGVELVPALVLAAALVVVGGAFVRLARRPAER